MHFELSEDDKRTEDEGEEEISDMEVEGEIERKRKINKEEEKERFIKCPVCNYKFDAKTHN